MLYVYEFLFLINVLRFFAPFCEFEFNRSLNLELP